MNKDLDDKQNSVNHLKKENRKARKMLAEYQLMIRSGASGMHKVVILLPFSQSGHGGLDQPSGQMILSLELKGPKTEKRTFPYYDFCLIKTSVKNFSRTFTTN